MKHFYHGLFGSTEDWSPFTAAAPGTILHDLYREKKDQLLSLVTSPDDILVGYSLGGRIALEIARRNNFNLRSIILLSAHPGLDVEEKPVRKIWEENVLEKMMTNGVKEFSRFWNQQEIFNSSKLNTSLTTEYLRRSGELFNQFRLSEMSFNLSSVSQHFPKISWVIGQKDKKYFELIGRKVLPLGIETMSVNADHRVLTARDEISHFLRQKGVT